MRREREAEREEVKTAIAKLLKGECSEVRGMLPSGKHEWKVNIARKSSLETRDNGEHLIISLSQEISVVSEEIEGELSVLAIKIAKIVAEICNFQKERARVVRNLPGLAKRKTVHWHIIVPANHVKVMRVVQSIIIKE